MIHFNLAAFLMSLLAGLAIHLFFKVIKRYGPGGQTSGPDQGHPQTAYLSVSDYVATRPQRRLYYLAFRHLPPLIVTMLLCGLLNKLFPPLWTLPYLLTATFSSVLFGSFREALRRGVYLSERLVHVYNVIAINFMAVLMEFFSHTAWLAAATPSLEGIVDNIWSSLFVSLIIVAFMEFSSRRYPTNRFEERRDVTERFVAASLSSIESRFGNHVDSLCGSDLLLRRLMKAILVFEDMNRPAWVRMLERVLVRVPGVAMTVGVAQVRSERPLSDLDSITVAHKLLTEGRPPADVSRGEESRLKYLIGVHNGGAKYMEDVLSVYRLVPVG